MHATVDGFGHGLVTPLAALLVACASGALGLRCLTRSRTATRSWRTAWLAGSSAALGTGIWVMHTIAMMGFTVAHATVGYDPLTSFASLGVAIVMVGTGIFMVGYRGSTGAALFTGGTIVGLGIASLHYLAMASIRLHGRLEYSTLVVTASVLVAVTAATVGLWAAQQRGGLLWGVAASLSMGIAGTGMHYVAMAAVRVRLYGPTAAASGESPVKALTVMLIGPVVFLLLLTAAVLAHPRLVAAAQVRNPQTTTAQRLAALPTQRTTRTEASRTEASRTGFRAGPGR